MKWKKLGKLFDPTEYLLPYDCLEYAQSPQTIVFDDFVRIYYSTRSKDTSNGKYRSQILYIDVDKQFTCVISMASKPVIELGKLGCFDEHGIFPMNVLRHEDRILAYTCGWNRRQSVSVDTSRMFFN
jgi:hypothetical protein